MNLLIFENGGAMKSNRSDELQAVLSEYQTLREEIQRRSNNQLLCVTASTASVGVLIGFISGDIITRSFLLLVVSWILAVFGIMWLDHNIRIFELGRYIKDKIEEKKLKAIFKSSNIKWIGWEHYLSDKRKKSLLRSFIVAVFPLIYFIVPSIISVIFYIQQNLKCIPIWPVFLTGVLIIILFVEYMRSLLILSDFK